jgi:hypothetical protein
MAYELLELFAMRCWNCVSSCHCTCLSHCSQASQLRIEVDEQISSDPANPLIPFLNAIHACKPERLKYRDSAASP